MKYVLQKPVMQYLLFFAKVWGYPRPIRESDLRAENLSVSGIRLARAGQDRVGVWGIKPLPLSLKGGIYGINKY